MASDALNKHKEAVVKSLENWPRLQQLIALQELPTLSGFHGLPHELEYEILKEFNKSKYQ